MESFPPQALMCLDVCGVNTQRIQRFSVGQEGEEMEMEGVQEEEINTGHSPNHSLNLLPVLGVNLISVLRSHQHGSKTEG